MTNPAGSATSAVVHGDNCRYGGAKAVCDPNDLNSGVSGTYVGTSGPSVYGDVLPLSVSPYYTVFPAGYQSVSFIVCDLEVLSDGSTKGNPEDEELVDTWPGGLVPDGTWDDGGQGGACHKDIYAKDEVCFMDESVVDCPSYNTYGCSGSAHAEDALVGGYVWLSTACDFEISFSSFGSATCQAGVVRAGGNGLADCLQQLTCTTCGVGEFIACGSDGQADAVNYGKGGGHSVVKGPNPKPDPPVIFSYNKEDNLLLKDGVPYPPVSKPGCASDAVAISYVVTAVEANVGSLVGDQLDQLRDPLTNERIFKSPDGGAFQGAGAEPSVRYSTPVGGWIDWTGGLGNNGYPEGTGLAIQEVLPVPDPPACADGSDNDDDGVTDYPEDGDCTDPLDGTESGGAPNPTCFDQRDNDGDGLFDYPSDPGCSGPSDTSERGTAVCDDGIDNDGDGSTDYPNDPGCSNPSDGSEVSPMPACNDGLDNDGDGRVDYPNDPGCASSTDANERGWTECDDGSDNDGDRARDFPADPDCTGPEDDSERPPPPPPPSQPPGGRPAGHI